MANSNEKKKSSVPSKAYILKEFESIKKPLMTELYEAEKDCMGYNFACSVFTALGEYLELFPECPLLGPLKLTVAQKKLVQKLIKAGCYKDNYFDEYEAEEIITKKDQEIYDSIQDIEIACSMIENKCQPDVSYYRIHVFQSSLVPHIIYFKSKKEATMKLFDYIVTFGGLIPWNLTNTHGIIIFEDNLFVGYGNYCKYKKRAIPIKANKEQKGIVLTPDQCYLIYRNAMQNNQYSLLYNIAQAKKKGKGLEIPFSCRDIGDAIYSSVQALDGKTEDCDLLEIAKLQKFLQASYNSFQTK